MRSTSACSFDVVCDFSVIIRSQFYIGDLFLNQHLDQFRQRQLPLFGELFEPLFKRPRKSHAQLRSVWRRLIRHVNGKDQWCIAPRQAFYWGVLPFEFCPTFDENGDWNSIHSESIQQAVGHLLSRLGCHLCGRNWSQPQIWVVIYLTRSRFNFGWLFCNGVQNLTESMRLTVSNW